MQVGFILTAALRPNGTIGSILQYTGGKLRPIPTRSLTMDNPLMLLVNMTILARFCLDAMTKQRKGIVPVTRNSGAE
jgi:hypothetical protein